MSRAGLAAVSASRVWATKTDGDRNWGEGTERGCKEGGGCGQALGVRVRGVFIPRVAGTRTGARDSEPVAVPLFPRQILS
eukprot:3781070-Rhodomonas_salina.1